MLDFLNPAAFLFLLTIPILIASRKIGIFSKPSFPLILSDWEGKNFVFTGKIFTLTFVFKRILLYVAFLALILAFSDPVLRSEERIYNSRGTDVIFVLDTSPSMAAKDMDGTTRLDSAKNVIKLILDQDSGTSFGLVGMATEAVLSVPPTTDRKTFLERLDSLIPGLLGEGSALGTGLSMAVYHLSNSTAPEKCIILLTDGENNAGSIHPETAADLALAYNIKLYAVGIGTRGNVPLEYTDPITGKISSGYLDSKFDSSPLQKISLMTGGRYFQGSNITELSAALNNISNHERTEQSYQIKTVENHFADELLIFASICIIFAWILAQFVLKEDL